MRTNKSLARTALLATGAATVTGATLAPGHGLLAMVSGAPATAAVHAEPGAPSADTGGKEERRTREPAASAYGLALTGPIPIAPMPSVASTAAEVRRTLLRENSTRHVSAAAMETRAAARHADATVSDLRVPLAGLTADAITARCMAGTGSSRLVNGMLAGDRLVSDPRPNTTIPIRIPQVGTAWVTFNKQQRLPDGRLSVTGMETTFPLGPLGRETLRTANAVCGHATSAPAEPAAPDGAGTSGGGPHGGSQAFDLPAAPAPKPSPVRGDLPVTG